MSWPSLRGGSVTEPNAILACEARSRLRLGWFEGKGWVEFRVAAREAGGSTVELEQRMHASNDRALIEQAYIGCTEGWAFYLTNLKSVAESGHDLREKRVDRAGLINV